MKIAVEIYAEKQMDIREGTFFKTALTTGGQVLAGSEGADGYGFYSVITGDKRVAGLGRSFIYTLASFPAGMGSIESRPGSYLDLAGDLQDLALLLETNLILDPGVLVDRLGIRLVGQQGKSVDIPLIRPDVTVWWEGRGKYTIPLAGLLKSRVLQAVS